MKQLLPWFLVPAGLLISADNPVPDPALAAAITKYLPVGRPASPLTTEKLESMILVNARDTPIRDLSGLERCTKLKFLFLAGSQASDLAPLAGLKTLTNLSIRRNKVASAAPLAGMNVEILHLDQNQITDLTPLIAMFRQAPPSSRPAFLYRSLSIRENPLSADAVAHQLPELGKYIFDVQADSAPH